jgi:hypothetical protein
MVVLINESILCVIGAHLLQNKSLKELPGTEID